MARVARQSQAVDVDAGGRADRGAHLCVRDRRSGTVHSRQDGSGAHFGLTPKKYQSGETDVTGRISKIGDAAVRTALYEAAHVMLTKPVKGCAPLKSWAMRIARRAGMRKAKVALARKLAVILHRMLADATPFNAAMRSGLTGDKHNSFRAGHDTRPSRSEVPSPGRWIRSDRCPSSRHCDHAFVDWSACPLQTPSGGGLAPTPYRSEIRRVDNAKGIDQSRPVTEGWAKARSAVPTSASTKIASQRRRGD